MPRKRGLLFSVLAVGGFSLLGFFIYVSGPRMILDQLMQVGAVGFITVLCNVLAFLLAWLLSWTVLLRSAGIRVPWRTAIGALLAGFAVSYVTPSMHLGGEPVRAYAVARKAELPVAQVMATVVLERLLAGVAVLAVAAMGGVFVLASHRITTTDKQGVAIGIGIAAALLAVILASFFRDCRWLSRALSYVGRRFPRWNRLVAAAARVREMERGIYDALSQRLWHTLCAFVLQLTVVSINFLRPQVFAYFTQRELFSFSQLSTYYTLNVFLTGVFWITPGGVGIAEGGRIGILALVGVSASGAMAFSMVYRLAELLIVTVGVLLLVRWGAVRLARPAVGVSDISPASVEPDRNARD